MTKVSPTWSISTTTFATVDASGNVLNTNATDRDQPVTLTAVCLAGDVTKTATMTVTLAKRVFSSVTIEGDGAILAGNAVNYVCLANWSVGEPTVVTASWSLSSTTHATVDTAGKVTNRNTTEADQTVTLNASHTIDDLTKTGSKTIMLTKRMLLDLAINGVATVGSGESASYLCEASWSDGATTAVKATWSLDSTEYASVDANGRVKNMNTTADDQTVTLTVTFTSGGETKTESKVLTLVKRTLADLAIVGDSAIANGLTAHPLPAMLNRQGEIFQEELDKPQTRGNELAAENQSRWNGLLGRTRAESTTPSKIITGPLVTTIWDLDG